MTADTAQTCASEFTAALIRRDIESALALLTDDVVFFYSNGSVIRGKEAFAGVMTASWKIVSDYKYETLDSSWIAETADAATVIYAFNWSGTAGDKSVTGGGRGTRVFSKQPGGWLIAHEHLSSGQW
jgi:ketosteroid isomerase-like protein